MMRPLKSEPCAILVADMVGYSNWLAAQPLLTHRQFAHHLQTIFAPCVQSHAGRLVKTTGDGFLAVHKTSADAELCARRIQHKIEQQDLPSSVDTPILEYRLAVHFGPVIEEPKDVFGLAVNAAIHMQTLAQPGGICLSDVAFDQLSEEAKKRYRYIGRKYLKNLPDPVPIFCSGEPEESQRLPGIIADPHRTRRFFLSPPPRLGIAELENCVGSGSERALSQVVQNMLHRAYSRYREALTVVPVGWRSPTSVSDHNNIRSLSGDQLHLDYILFGSLIAYQGALTLSVRLEHATKGELIWTELIQFDEDHLRSIDHRIVVECVTPSVFYLHKHHADEQNRSGSAYESQFQLARRLLSRGSLESTGQARQLLSNILDRCGDIGNVHVAMARAEHLHGRLLAGQPFVDSLNRAHKHAVLAIEIDELNPQAHAELALQEMFLKRQTTAANIYRRALRLNPDDPMLLADWANCLTFLGRSQEALPILESVASGWPRDRNWVEWNLCDALWALDQPDRILSLLDTRSELPHVHRYLAAANAKLGRGSEASYHAGMVQHYQPSFSTKAWSSVVPHTQSDTSEEYVEFLQRAGL